MGFQCKMLEFMKDHCPRVIILLEARISGDTVDTICRSWEVGSGFIRRQMGLARAFGSYRMMMR